MKQIRKESFPKPTDFRIFNQNLKIYANVLILKISQTLSLLTIYPLIFYETNRFLGKQICLNLPTWIFVHGDGSSNAKFNLLHKKFKIFMSKQWKSGVNTDAALWKVWNRSQVELKIQFGNFASIDIQNSVNERNYFERLFEIPTTQKIWI